MNILDKRVKCYRCEKDWMSPERNLEIAQVTEVNIHESFTGSWVDVTFNCHGERDEWKLKYPIELPPKVFWPVRGEFDFAMKVWMARTGGQWIGGSRFSSARGQIERYRLSIMVGGK